MPPRAAADDLRLFFAYGTRYHGTVAKSLEAIVIGGTCYRVLRLSGRRGPAYLLRSEAGDVFGLFRYGHEPTRLYASALAPGTPAPAFDAVELFDEDGRVAVHPRRT